MGRERNERDKDLPSGLYRRGDSESLWMWFVDIDGKRKGRSTGESDVGKALMLRKAVLRKIEAIKKANGGETGPLTVARRAKQWVEDVRKRKPANAGFHEDNLAHAMSHIGEVLLEELEEHHLFDMVKSLEADKKLSRASILHVYGSLRVMLRDAKRRKLIAHNPCTLSARAGELPKKRPTDPEWKKKHLFTRDEIATLCADERLPQYRRAFYALSFLTGMRTGEAINRRWADYENGIKPLGKLTVATAYDRKNHVEKATKSEVAREVPVHPALAALLAEWKLSGWARTYGRAPTPDDFIVARPPNKAGAGGGERISPKGPWVWLNGKAATKTRGRRIGDLERLGLRARRVHDTRRTFISLAEDDGARSKVLESITHGESEGGAYALYRTYAWETKCAEVEKLKLFLPRRAVAGS